MLNPRVRRIVARVATLLMASGLAVIAIPTAASAACLESTDVVQQPPLFNWATLNTTTGQIVYEWYLPGWADAWGCAGTMTVSARLTDRSIVPTMSNASNGWVVTATDSRPDGTDYGYRGGDSYLDVSYRDSFTAPMRGTLGQVTAEVKVVFTPSGGGPSTTQCSAYTKTFTSTPTGPQVLSESPDTCLP
ncbi:MAG: hypothetical protein QOC82_2575 [Frankiaceae bacterium]|jgi:hypothetical protein|nr:hypothetical protein [Frankiaceae bacterium]MDQ1698649.1 hypothetical protein [Frankiaceae bacterium]